MDLPANPLLYAVAVLGGAVMFSAFAFWTAAWTRNAEAAQLTSGPIILLAMIGPLRPGAGRPVHRGRRGPGRSSPGPLREDGAVSRARMDKRPDEVAAMFDTVAGRYDVTNDVLSLGQDRLWRRAVLRALDARPGERVLDLAAGTGTSSQPIADSGVHVVATDFSLGMLRVGKRRRPDLPFTAGDATRLPFADAVFDAVTVSFGLRNVVDPDLSLRELLRVTRPGGRLLVCEFSHPVWAPFRSVYVNYLMRALPPVARRVSSNPESYEYLAESIRAWPAQEALARRLQQAGWRDVAWRNLTGGVVALHRAARPLADAVRPTRHLT